MKTSKKINFPFTFSFYLIVEFLKSLNIFVIIIFTLIFITNFVEEMLFLKDNKLENNIYLHTFFFTSIKSPSLILNLFPFIFLFSGIHFFIKLMRSNEYSSLKISGVSNSYIITIPALFSFFLSILIILIFTPISSQMIKFYEKEKKNITGNENLIFLNDNGIWLKEKNIDKELIIMQADGFNNIKENYFLKNLKIFKHNSSGSLVETFISENAEFKKNKILLKNVNLYSGTNNKKNFYKEIEFQTNIKFSELINLFSNSDTFSIWNILENLKILKARGYLGDELVIKLHKYISFPFLIFSIMIFSTIFTINLKREFDNYTYSFFGIISGIGIYFLLDLSIAFGKSDRIPLSVSVWAPIILILILSTISLIRSNET